MTKLKKIADSIQARPICIRSDIKRDRVLRSGRLYIITGQVHVHAGVTLKVEDGVRIGILNGRVLGRRLQRAALVFDSGSILNAQRLTVYASGRGGVVQKKPDNGGIWFFGAHKSADKDGMKMRKSRSTPLSSFSARSLSARYLGCGDEVEGTAISKYDDLHVLDDLDAVSVMGVGLSEWLIEALHILGSGDDALDLENSDIRLRRVVISNPTEDALNISSSRLDITDELRVRMTRRGADDENNANEDDRDIFDLEVDDSPSHVTLHRGALIKLSGVLGDEIKLKTQDLPSFEEVGREPYLFSGRSARALTMIYSIDAD